MKVVKTVLFALAFLFIAGCAGVLICAFNPSLTEKLAGVVKEAVEKNDGSGGSGSNDSLNAGQPTATPEAGVPSATSVPQHVDSLQSGINTGWMNGSGESVYERPDRLPDKAPEGLGWLMGYKPVRGDEEQILDEEADNLMGILHPGDIGSGLTFNTEYYPYYAMLEPSMQQLYRQIYANARALTASFTPVVTVSVGQVKNVFEAVSNDHPELFWLEAGYSCKYLQSGTCVEITLKYNDTIDNLTTEIRKFEAAAENILTGARLRGSDLEKERYVHDALMQMTEYDEKASKNQSAYSCLVNGKSVCAGYSRAFQYLMQQLGIPCYYCTGTAGQDHAWNIVKLGETFYNVDVTWDDTNPATYDYFNRTDAAYAPTHVRTGLSVYLPACVERTDSAEGSALSAEILALINQSPTQPLRWKDYQAAHTSSPELTEEQKKAENLLKAGITADQVRETLKDYYADCKKLLVAAGTGDKTFDNVIPDSLWSTVERAYGNGDYWEAYMEDALKELKVENYFIQIQVQRLGGGYYRIYHNVYTY